VAQKRDLDSEDFKVSKLSFKALHIPRR
jgi:hypothetical protein